MEQNVSHTGKLKGDIPMLELTVDALQLPDVITKKTTTSSKLHGEETHTNEEKVPFMCMLSATKSNVEDLLSLPYEPDGNVTIKLQEKDGSLVMAVDYKYTDTETYYKTESYNHHWVPEGQHYPYGPVEPGYMECDTREVACEREVSKYFQNKNIPVTEENFDALYLGVLFSENAAKNPALLSYLHREFPTESEHAQGALKKNLHSLLERKRQETQLLEETFANLVLPKP